jgi:hypothetical protein
MDTDSELLAYMTEILNTTAENLFRVAEELRHMVAQQKQSNAELTEVLVSLGGSAPRPALRLVDNDSA